MSNCHHASIKVFTLICTASLCSVSFAAAPPMRVHARAYTHHRASKINRMETQLDQLEAQVKALRVELRKEKQVSHSIQTEEAKQKASVAAKYKTFGSAVVTAPFTGRPSISTGSQVLVNAPSVNEDLKLLYRRKIEQEALLKEGETIPDHPRLVLSGKLSGKFVYSRPFAGARSTDINLSEAEIDAFAEISPLTNAFFAISYDDNPNTIFSNHRLGNSNIYLDRAFIVIGDVKRSPFYGSVGQMYVPFGRYSSSMISSPLDKYIGKTKARAILLGYAPNWTVAPYARAFVFKGSSKYGNSNLAKDYGGDLGLRYTKNKFHTNVGISYISNIANANGQQNTGAPANFQGFDKSNLETLVHRVGGFDIHGSMGIGPWSLLAEYVTALQQYSQRDLTYNSHGAKPNGFNLEGAYAFKVFNMPSSFALGYGLTNQSLGLYLPRQRYAATFMLNFLKDASLSFEYRHDINYGRSANATANNGALQAYVLNELGRSDDIFTTELSVYF